MDNVYVYLISLPSTIHEMVTPCADGYTVYINSEDDKEMQKESYLHALYHIQNNDFEKYDPHKIEEEAHEKSRNLYESIHGETGQGR